MGWRGTRIRQTYQLTNTRAKCERQKLMVAWNKKRAKISAAKNASCLSQYMAVKNVVGDDFCPQDIWTALYLDMPLIITPVKFFWAKSILFLSLATSDLSLKHYTFTAVIFLIAVPVYLAHLSHSSCFSFTSTIGGDVLLVND